eukprot:scaffold4346_cov155-Skeletonema_dohrnii-CCMP3373.AAC.3
MAADVDVWQRIPRFAVMMIGGLLVETSSSLLSELLSAVGTYSTQMLSSISSLPQNFFTIVVVGRAGCFSFYGQT